MASLNAGGMLSLAESKGHAGATSAEIVAAFNKVQHISMTKETKVTFIEGRNADVTFEDLPLRVLDPNSKIALKHWVDIVPEHAEAFDSDLIHDAMEKHEYHRLPGVLAPKGNFDGVAFEMQIALAPSKAAGKVDVVKHYIFSAKKPPHVIARMHQGVACSLSHGDGGHPKISMKVWQDMFQRLGGRAWLRFALSGEVQEAKPQKPLLPKHEISAAFDFIKDEAPRGNFDNEQLRWVEEQLNDPNSPAHKLPRTVIKEALANIRASRTMLSSSSTIPFVGTMSPPSSRRS